MLQPVFKNRRMEKRARGSLDGRQFQLDQDQQTRGFEQLATNPNPGPNTVVLPNLDPLIESLPPSSPIGSLNLTPIISAISAPSWMALKSPQPTLSPTIPSTATLASLTSSPSHTSVLNTLTIDHSITMSTLSCSGSTPCPTMTSATDTASTLASSPAESSNPTDPNDFFASLGSSAGSIFVTTLVGLAILGVIVAISSWGLRRWCNRRRRKMIDEDTWRFLNTPKEFTKGPLDDDLGSVKSMRLGFSGSRPHVLLHNDNPAHNPTPVSFHTHLQQPHNVMSQIGDPSSTPTFLPLVGFHPSQPPRLSCFMDKGQRSWMNNSSPNRIRSSLYGGVILGPIGPSTTDHPSAPTAPEAAYASPRTEFSHLHGSGVGLGEPNLVSSNLTVTARPRSSAFIPPLDTDDNTPLTSLPRSLSARTRRHPLARELSLARSDASSTVEILRARVQDQKIDIRSKLFGAIQSESEPLEERCWSPSDVLSVPSSDSIRNPYVPIGRVQPATPRPLQIFKRPSVTRYQLTDEPPPALNRELSQGSCYSVTTTVIPFNQKN
ncbi:hypothetical protein CROQUDRAFT_670448 [Cronartium quercuum f. sp. fusiforme G11]|uniref:Uncharacterized protein n=1 Tax=Cronartium quercuum f. sp. fusiforme G11 TaxID=708437 RepID=A0A9P6NKC0_9BASI|nr:hypothetical protein CROQUDRAFT_670448 [Cronartium quercuum f. sp. fusiforme G11]